MYDSVGDFACTQTKMVNPVVGRPGEIFNDTQGLSGVSRVKIWEALTGIQNSVLHLVVQQVANQADRSQ